MPAFDPPRNRGEWDHAPLRHARFELWSLLSPRLGSRPWDRWDGGMVGGGWTSESNGEIMNTLQGTNISRFQGTFEDDFPFPQVGYVNSLEGMCNML